MYLVRPMRGTVSELGLKQLFRLLSNTLGRQNDIPLKPSRTKIGDRATMGRRVARECSKDKGDLTCQRYDNS